MTDDEEGVVYQAGAFTSESEAQKVVDLEQRGPSRTDGVNLIPVFASAEEWQANR